MKKLILSLLLCLAVLTGCQPGEINETIYFDQVGDNITDAHKVQDLYVVNLWADSSNISGGGGGNVTGPVASTDNAIVRWDGVLGNALQDYTSNPPTISDTGDMDIDGDIASDSLITNYIDVTEAVEPASPAANNMRMFALDEHGYSVLSYKDAGGMVRQFMRDSVFIAYNDTGATIAAGRIVYAEGSTGTVPEIALAKADSASTMPAIGVTVERLLHGEYGRVMQIGILENVNTSAYSAGDVLWVSETTAGIPTSTQPTSPHISQEIGTILVDNAVTGAIQIVARSRIAFGVSDNNTVQVDGSPNDNEYARWTAYGLEGLSAANVTSDLGVATISQSNVTIYVDFEATGVADGTSWADAYTSIQDAIDSTPSFIVHDYTVYVRAGTKKTGTADENTANHLVDDASSQFTASDVGKRVYNLTDGLAWGVVASFVDAGDVSIVDVDGNAYDLFPDGDEDYVISGTPYRERLYFNGDPASYPAHHIPGSFTVRGEYYWQANCDANVNTGDIIDASANFSAVELGDMVYVYDLNGANGRMQAYEVGTVTDITQAGSGNISTNMSATATTNWGYVIVKTHISGSDNGTIAGIARQGAVVCKSITNVFIDGFYCDLGSNYFFSADNARGIEGRYIIAEYVSRGFYVTGWGKLVGRYFYCHTTANYFGAVRCYIEGAADVQYCVHNTNNANSRSFTAERFSHLYMSWFYCENTARGLMADELSNMQAYRGTIAASVAVGAWTRRNSTINLYQTTNNAVPPEDPAGTTDNPFID